MQVAALDVKDNSWKQLFYIKNGGMEILKIINGKQLGFMPDGTVFSNIVDDYFDSNG